MNSLRPTWLAVLLVLLYVPVQAQKVFDFNDRCKQAYHEIIQLKLNNGQQLLNAEKAQHRVAGEVQRERQRNRVHHGTAG